MTDLLILADLAVGGPAAGAAVAAARLGLRVALVASVGDDQAGHFMLTELAREGVNISGVGIRDDGSSGKPVALAAADIPGPLLAGARHVHVSSYFQLERSLGPGLAAMFKASRAGGTTTSLDANADPAGQWDSGQLDRVLRQCDLLLANEAGAMAMTGAESPRAAAAVLAAGDRSVVVRLGADGADGAVCRSGSQQHSAAAGPAGAAGWFDAGLLAGMLRGLSLPEAMALGCAVARAPATGPGGTARCPDLPAALELARKVTVRPES